ncbi:MAG: hypothetical protein HY901_25870 [Deltaproteobacteria bacterium]|nr:hypothetical protein [Deltaproteobacteria bacterium]
MANVDLNGAIRGLVAAEVERALEPYRLMLDRLASVIGAKPERAAPGRAPKAGAAPRRGPKPARAGKGDASKFQEGQAVRYRQGRGEFEATVLAIDTERNVVTVERAKDGKKVERPAAKIY